MALETYDFTAYADRSALLAAGWDFQATATGGSARDTESGNATYGAGGMTFPVVGGAPWAGNSVDNIFRDLDEDWESVVVEMDWFGGYISARSAGLIIYQDDGNFVMASRDWNGDFIAYWNVGGSVSWSDTALASAAMRFWLKISREENTYALQYSFDGVAFSPITSRTQALTAPRLGIWVGDNNGASDNTATILGASVNVRESSGGIRIGGEVPSIRLDYKVVSAMYLDDIRIYSATPFSGTAVTFTTTGETFTPEIELVSGSTATVQWLDDVGNILAVGATPSIDFGAAATRTVHMVVSDGPDPGFDDVLTINLGYNNGQDAGIDMVGPEYDKDPESISAVANVNVCTKLKRLLIANTAATGLIDMSGMTDLEHAEFFNSSFDSVDLTGCASLIRLCLESNSVAEIDLNPVRSTLVDLRAADQQGSAGLEFATMDGPLEILYHFCVRDVAVTNMPDPSTMMPTLAELWIWNSGQTGTLTVTTSSALASVLAHNNGYTAADLSGTSWGEYSSLRLDGNSLATIDLDTIDGPGPGDIRLDGNGLSESQVDYVLACAASWGRTGGSLDLTGNAVPSAAADADISALEAADWTLSLALPAPDRTLLWEDTFDRTAGAPGNGWTAGVGSVTPTLDGTGGLVFPSGSSYSTYVNAATGTLPADLSVDVDFTRPLAGGDWWGILARENSSDLSGSKVLITNVENTQSTLGSAAVFSGPSLSLTPPAGWFDTGDHTLRVDFIGSTISVYMDGELAGSGTDATNSSLANGRIGICGEPQARTWNAFRAYAV